MTDKFESIHHIYDTIHNLKNVMLRRLIPICSNELLDNQDFRTLERHLLFINREIIKHI